MTQPNWTEIGLGFCLMVAACGDDGSTDTTAEGSETTSDTTSTTSTTSPTETGTTVEPTGESTGGPACGDGDVDDSIGEECDDGNSMSGDTCNADCTWPVADVWTVDGDGPGGHTDRISDIIMDGEGNIYAVGAQWIEGEQLNLWVAVHAPDGTEMWNVTRDGAASGLDSGSSIAFHPSGDLLVVGEEDVTDEGDNILVARLSATDGSEIWAQIHNDSASEDDFGNGVASDADGNVIAAGTVRTTDERWNIWVRKFDGDGMEIWTVTHNGNNDESDFGSDVVTDAAGAIYVAGTEAADGQGDNGWLRKYDADGMEVWTAVYDNGGFNQGYNAVTLDGDGNVITVGFDGSSRSVDALVRKHDGDGAGLWTVTVNGPSNGTDSASGVTVDGSNDVYYAGFVSRAMQSSNIWGQKLTGDGDLVWAIEYNNEAANLDDNGSAVAVDSNGDVVFAGRETVIGEDTNKWMRKYQQL